MSDWEKRVEDKLDKHQEQLEAMNITLVKNTETLIVHEKRSTTNEASLQLLRDEVKPLTENYIFFNKLVKVFSVVVSLLLLAKELKLF